MMKKNSLQQKKKLYQPKFWIYWVGIGFLWCFVQFPWCIRMRIGDVLGRIAFRLVKKRRNIAITNIRAVYPELSEQEQNKLIKKFSYSVGRGFIETGMGWFWSDKKIFKNSEMHGDKAAIDLIYNPDIPVIFVGSHSTLLELGARLIGLYTSCSGVYRPLSDEFFNEWITYKRSRSANELVLFRNMRHVLKVLKSNGNLWYALDQDMGKRVSVKAPFFGIDACSVNILPQLRDRTGARWVPIFTWRDDDTKKYYINVLPEIKPVEGESDTAVMTRVNAVLEEEIRKHPEQYFWVHRRFKNSTDGKVNYPSM